MKKIYFVSLLFLVLLLLTVFVVLITTNSRRISDNKVETETDEIVTRMETPEVTSWPFFEEYDSVSFALSTKSKEYNREQDILILNYAEYPCFEGYSSAEKINNILETEINKLIAISSTEKQVAEEYFFNALEIEPFQKNCHSRVYQKGKCISVIVEISESNGGVTETQTLKVYNFNAESGEKTTLSYLLGWNRATTVAYVKNAFSVLASSDGEKYYDDALEIIETAVFDNDYYFCEDGIMLFLNSGFISPEVYGRTEFLISYDELK